MKDYRAIELSDSFYMVATNEVRTRGPARAKVRAYKRAEVYLPPPPALLTHPSLPPQPTLPPICSCGVNSITVSPDELTYVYTNTDICTGLKDPFQIHIGGKIDPTFPGSMSENAIIHGHQLKNLDPNYVFHVERGGGGGVEVAYTYACLGHGLFSFNVLAKSRDRSTEEIERMIGEVDGMVGEGVLKIENMRITNSSQYEACGL